MTVTLNGEAVTFDSKSEYARWLELCEEQAASRISGLARQRFIRVMLPTPAGERVRAFTYKADFVYVRAGKFVIEDRKSSITKKNPTYRLKKKIIRIVLGFEIVETEAKKKRCERSS